MLTLHLLDTEPFHCSTVFNSNFLIWFCLPALTVFFSSLDFVPVFDYACGLLFWIIVMNKLHLWIQHHLHPLGLYSGIFMVSVDETQSLHSAQLSSI